MRSGKEAQEAILRRRWVNIQCRGRERTGDEKARKDNDVMEGKKISERMKTQRIGELFFIGLELYFHTAGTSNL